MGRTDYTLAELVSGQGAGKVLRSARWRRGNRQKVVPPPYKEGKGLPACKKVTFSNGS